MNGIDIISSLTDGVDHNIIIIDDVIKPRDIGAQDFLRGIDDVSIFYSLLKKTPLVSLVKSLSVHKVCFTKDICLPVRKKFTSGNHRRSLEYGFKWVVFAIKFLHQIGPYYAGPTLTPVSKS